MAKPKILVVDDEPDLVDLLRLRLEQKGFEVQSAHDGLQVFTRLEEQKPDLIILDVMMPKMDGFEVLKRLKASEETSRIPVIMLTAKVRSQDILHGYELGADYYLTKPFTTSQLLLAVNVFLNGKNPSPQNS